MQTSYVREFLETTRTLNYAEAADNLYVSHSALFKHIKALEEELGGTLFDRDGHTITLSAYGQVFLPYAEKLVRAEEACMSALAKWQGTESHNIAVSCDYRMLNLICEFQEKYPQYQISYTEGDTAVTSEEQLTRGLSELALLCDSRLDPAEYERIPFCTDYMAAVLPANHPLAGQETIRLEQLAEENFIGLSSNAHTRYWDEVFQRAGFRPKISMTCIRGTGVVECIVRGGGCSVLMESLTRSQDNSGIAVIRLEPELKIRIDFWVQRSRPQSMALQSFLKFVQVYRKKHPTG